LKEAVKGLLAGQRREVVDVGTFSRDAVDYPDYAEAVGRALLDNRAERGIILCGSGVGASMAANRLPGIRAGLCHDTYSAHQGVEHDDMNVLVLGGRVVGVELARELIEAFLNAQFTGAPRRLRRLAKLTALENPLRALGLFGQSVWLDYIRRSLLTSGELRRLIDDDDVRGVTSNPSIFEKAMTGSSDYVSDLEARSAENLDAQGLYEALAIRDIQQAADALGAVYQRTGARDGYVSLEVSPLVAHNVRQTLGEARRLWKACARENLMIKLPATTEGIAAAQQLIAEGVNVNVTLLFGLDAYERVAQAYIGALEKRAARGEDLTRIASVASFFVSRIDTAIDVIIAERVDAKVGARQQRLLHALRGKVAIANAKLTYQRYRELFAGPRWQALAAQGARPQRLLWASTATKNAALRDVAYVEELIGPDTVTTIPPVTLDAFRDHGRPRASLMENLEAAADTMERLRDAGISIKDVATDLLNEGLSVFTHSYGTLLKTVEKQCRRVVSERAARISFSLPGPMREAVNASLLEWQTHEKVRRLWARDSSLWTGKDEAQWLGWLGIANGQLAHIHRLTRLSEAASQGRYSHVLLLGMGGASLGVEVLRKTFGRMAGFPELLVLDSTDPAQVKSIERSVDLAKCFLIVSSKSGSTLETNIFAKYFFDQLAARVGTKEASARFAAITDPGSPLQFMAENLRFHHVFYGWPDIGGRYSILSDFGLVPAALMGVNVGKLLDRAEGMACACMPTVPIEDNPGVTLGTILGVAARQFGRDKLTLIASPRLAAIGAWLEQLVAESTGKDGRGVVPIIGETVGPPESYGRDRLFVHLQLSPATDAAQEAAVAELERAGHPVVRLVLDDEYDIGGEFFRWQIATAVAGSHLAVHPFDQPDVEASKFATRRITTAYEQHATLPTEMPFMSYKRLKLFADRKNVTALSELVNRERTLPAYLKAHLDRIDAGDYVALLAYVEMNDVHEKALEAIRWRIRDAKHVATCLQFGPRFLHSTGQAYKGGPNSGVFLQITCDDAHDIPVPGHRYTFGIVKAAQASGDFQVLAERDRRALRVHLTSDVAGGLAMLEAALDEALGS
jgi:transaldolase/glucose-6-phosphate isomerase